MVDVTPAKAERFPGVGGCAPSRPHDTRRRTGDLPAGLGDNHFMAPIKASGSAGAGATKPSAPTSKPITSTPKPTTPSARASMRTPAAKSSFQNPLGKRVDLGTPEPFGLDPKKIIDAVKKGVKVLSSAFGDLQSIAKEYDPELGARAGIEGVLHTGTSWLAKSVPFIGKPLGTLIDRLFNKPPPKSDWPSPPPPVSANPPLAGDLANSKYAASDAVPLFGPKGPLTPADVRQVGLGDCYFMASMAGLSPAQVNDMVHDNTDGTFTVRLYDVGSDGKITPAFVRVTGELPDPPGADWSHGNKWSAIIEKAYATHLGSYDVAAGNNNPKFFAAPTVLTGRTTVAYATPLSDPTVLFEQLSKSTADGRPAFAGFYGANHDGLYGNHAYTVEATRTDPATGQRYVTVRNPWGHGEFGADGEPRDGKDDGVFEMPLEEFMKTYQAVAVAGG